MSEVPPRPTRRISKISKEIQGETVTIVNMIARTTITVRIETSLLMAREYNSHAKCVNWISIRYLVVLRASHTDIDDCDCTLTIRKCNVFNLVILTYVHKISKRISRTIAS